MDEISKMLRISSVAFLIIAATLVVGVPRKPHKFQSKHFSLNLRDHHMSDINSAFNDYRNAESKRFFDASSTEIARDNESDEYFDSVDNHLKKESFHQRKSHQAATSNHHQNHQNSHGSNLRNRRHRHRHHTTLKTTTPTTTTAKSRRTSPNNFDHNDDDEDDYYDDPTNRQYGDDAHAPASRSNRVIRHDHHQQPSSGSESLTDFKLKTLSSRDGVEKSFQQYVEETSKEKDKLVVQHVRRFRIDAKCQWPSRKVIDAPSTAYTPRRYVVFKCSDDTACCNSHEETCAAKNSKQVDLWFRVGKGFEMLRVSNDTECHCVKFEKLMSSRGKSLDQSEINKPQPKCKCPSNFIAEIDAEGCNCNCYENDTECKLRYEGKEGFTLSDQSCIRRKDCTMPHCLHGIFSTTKGRCPNENDKYNASFARTRRRPN